MRRIAFAASVVLFASAVFIATAVATPPTGDRHIAANYGKEHVLITTMYFNLPHGEQLPGPAGNQLTAADFSQAPPADCPRLR
jgi:hypothetical protein